MDFPGRNVDSREISIGFESILTVEIQPKKQKATADCFKNLPRNPTHYETCKNEHPVAFSKQQPSSDFGYVSAFKLARDGTFQELASLLQLTTNDKSAVEFGNHLIECHFALTLSQLEDLIERTMRNEKTGMSTDGIANLFFIQTGNPEYPVVLGQAYCNDDVWSVYFDTFSNEYRYHAGAVIFIAAPSLRYMASVKA